MAATPGRCNPVLIGKVMMTVTKSMKVMIRIIMIVVIMVIKGGR